MDEGAKTAPTSDRQSPGTGRVPARRRHHRTSRDDHLCALVEAIGESSGPRRFHRAVSSSGAADQTPAPAARHELGRWRRSSRRRRCSRCGATLRYSTAGGPRSATWVVTIARNKQIDHIRGVSRPNEAAWEPPEPDLSAASPDGEQILHAKQSGEILHHAIRTLPGEQELVLRQAFWRGQIPPRDRGGTGPAPWHREIADQARLGAPASQSADGRDALTDTRANSGRLLEVSSVLPSRRLHGLRAPTAGKLTVTYLADPERASLVCAGSSSERREIGTDIYQVNCPSGLATMEIVVWPATPRPVDCDDKGETMSKAKTLKVGLAGAAVCSCSAPARHRTRSRASTAGWGRWRAGSTLRRREPARSRRPPISAPPPARTSRQEAERMFQQSMTK